MKQLLRCTSKAALTVLLCHLALFAVDAARFGYVDVTRAPYNADSTGQKDATAAIQNALIATETSGKAVFLPAGRYMVSNTITVKKHGVLTGSTVDSDRRSVIVLPPNTSGFANPGSPKIVMHFDVDPDYGKYNVTYDRMINGIDFEIGAGNDGAIALRLRGAEGCGIFDVNIDMSASGLSGIWGVPGSGGSTHKVTITGGRYGISSCNLSACDSDGSQPGPTISGCTFINQSEYALRVYSRGAFVASGCRFVLSETGSVLKLLRGHNFHSSFCLADAVIESSNPSATAFRDIQRSFYLNNVYCKNTGTIYGDVAGKADGWVQVEELAVDLPIKAGGTPPPGAADGIYFDGTLYGTHTVYKDLQIDRAPPENLLRQHTWGETFPSFESPDVACVTDYAGRKDGDDWGPAIQAAVDEHEVVFFPPGEYTTWRTIQLKPNSKLIGTFHLYSQIWGIDITDKRFMDNAQPLRTQHPVIRTADTPDGNTILAHLKINVNGAVSGHSADPAGHYACQWMVGGDSHIRMVDFKPGRYGNIWYNMQRVIESAAFGEVSVPLQRNGLSFDTESEIFWIGQSIGNKLLSHQINGRGVLMTRWYRPEWYKPNCNMSISGAGFDLSSLDLYNGLYWEFDPRYTVTFRGHTAGGVVEKTVDFGADGKENPQSEPVTVTLNWHGLSKVEITSEYPFGINDVVSGGQTTSFNNLNVATLSMPCGLYHHGAQHLPIYPLNEAGLVITGHGGGTIYNWWQHGQPPYRPDVPFIRIVNNTGTVRFHHLHMQHCMNDTRLIMQNARNVHIYGQKTEIQSNLICVYNSDNIRIFGHAGMSNPGTGYHHYYFKDTPNFLVSNLNDDVRWSDGQNTRFKCDDPLPSVCYKLYDALVDDYNGTIYAPQRIHRPLLYRRGNPRPPAEMSSAAFGHGGNESSVHRPAVPVRFVNGAITAPEGTPLRVRLIDVAGRTVYRYAGRSRCVLPDAVARGTYIVEILAGARRSAYRYSPML